MKLIKVCLSLFLLFPLFTITVLAKGTDLAPDTSAVILMEQDTGTILYEKNSDKPLPPASMTKIMTMLLIMEQIERGKLSLDEKVRTSEYAASMGGSQIFLEAGEELTIHEMLKGIAIASANDASVALAERIAGSEEAFVKMMNKRAKELGLQNTKFQNTTGLSEKGHYTSAHDMAVISQELLKHPLITTYTSTYEDYLRQKSDKPFWLVNTNKLVKFYEGADGLKTGYTAEAKYCLTATAQRHGMRVIGVIMGASTSKTRNAQMTKLLDFAFNTYETKAIYQSGQTIKSLAISKGAKEKVPLVSEKNVSILLKKGEQSPKVLQEIKIAKSVKAPIKKGEKLGTLTLKSDGKIINTTPLLAKEEIKSASWWKIFQRTFQKITKIT